MYCEFFQLQEKPFNLTPDPRFLYRNENHREVLADLQYGILEKRGFIVITGEAGTGKTTHLFRFLNELDPRTRSAFLFNPLLNRREFFQYIFADLGLPSGLESKTDFLVQLNQLLLERAANGWSTLLIVDEAQTLSVEILEEIRLLSNLETPREKLLQIILMGQPELDEKLRSPQLRQLKQRIAIRGRILPLAERETGVYIDHRLQIAGFAGDWEIFPPETVLLLHRLSRGIPRVINNLCDNVLVSCYAMHRRAADREVILEVARDLDLLPGDGAGRGNGPAAGTDPPEERLLIPGSAAGDDALLREFPLVDRPGAMIAAGAPPAAARGAPAAAGGSPGEGGANGLTAPAFAGGERRGERAPSPILAESWERSLRRLQSFFDRWKEESD